MGSDSYPFQNFAILFRLKMYLSLFFLEKEMPKEQCEMSDQLVWLEFNGSAHLWQE